MSCSRPIPTRRSGASISHWCGRVTKSAHQDRACWQRSNSMPLELGRRSSPSAARSRIRQADRFRCSSFPRRLSYDSEVTLTGQKGYTFIEIAIVTAIVGILASAALPLARVTMQRNREIELRRSLREIRTAIDKYKDAVDQNLISPNDIDNDAEGYPPTLETLVEEIGRASCRERV